MVLNRFKLFPILLLLVLPSLAFAQANGDGLLGVYYNGTGFNTVVTTEIDPTLFFHWQGCPPLPGVSATAFSAKWTGQIKPVYSEAYTFSASFDGGVSLIVNGQVLVNQGVESDPATYLSGNISLTAGVPVSIEVDYFANNGSPSLYLFWQSPSQPLSSIPHEYLFSGTSPGPTPTPQVVTACQQSAIVNGLLSDWAWNQGPPFSSVTKTVYGQTFGSSALVKTLWDSNNLYLGTKVTDSQLTNTGPTAFWRNSAVEVYLNTNNDRSITFTSHDFEYIFQWGNTVPWEISGRTAGVTMKTTTTPGGYLVEAAIPWSTLGVTPQEGAALGFDVGVDVNHNGGNCRDGQLMFNGNNDNNLNTSAYATLDLGTACPTPVATPPAPSNKPYVYSNPSSGPNVTFVYDMAEAGGVRIVVLNDAGDVVATIQDNKPPGEQQSVLNIQSFAPGHYFYLVVLSYNSGRRDSYAPAVLAVLK